MTACSSFHMTREVYDRYTTTMRDAQRVRADGDEERLRELAVELREASDEFEPLRDRRAPRAAAPDREGRRVRLAGGRR